MNERLQAIRDYEVLHYSVQFLLKDVMEGKNTGMLTIDGSLKSRIEIEVKTLKKNFGVSVKLEKFSDGQEHEDGHVTRYYYTAKDVK